jgi:uncharacterized phage infection (PIP) family protein YhgE
MDIVQNNPTSAVIDPSGATPAQIQETPAPTTVVEGSDPLASPPNALTGNPPEAESAAAAPAPQAAPAVPDPAQPSPVTPAAVAAPTDESVIIGLANDYKAALATVAQIKALIPPAAQTLIEKNSELQKMMQKAKELAAEAVSKAHQAHTSLLEGLERAEADCAKAESALKTFLSNHAAPAPSTPAVQAAPSVPGVPITVLGSLT